MSVALKDGTIVLDGDCDVGEAEILFSLVADNPDAVVDIARAGAVHTALWQILIALQPAVTGESQDPFIRRWIVSRLSSRNKGSAV